MNIEQHQIRAQLAKALQSFFPVLRNAHAQAIALKIGAEDAGDAGFILHHQHQRGGRGLCKSIHGFPRKKYRKSGDFLNLVIRPLWLFAHCAAGLCTLHHSYINPAIWRKFCIVKFSKWEVVSGFPCTDLLSPGDFHRLNLPHCENCTPILAPSLWWLVPVRPVIAGGVRCTG